MLISAPSLLLAALAAAAPALVFHAPREGEAVLAPVEVVLDVPPETTSLTIEAAGQVVATLEHPPWRTTWPAEGLRGPFELRARASQRDGGSVEATIRVTLIQVDQAIEVPFVLSPVVVLDRHRRPVAGLTADDFSLRVDGHVTPIEQFDGGDAPFAIAIALDVSASMLGLRFEAARDAALALVERLGPRDRACLVAFDHRARLIQPLTSEPAEMKRALQQLATGGGTAIYDALALAIQVLEREPGRKAIVLLTDGADATSRASPAAVERAARASQVVLYTVSIGPDLGRGFPTSPPQPSPQEKRLQSLAGDLGGRALAPGTVEELLGGYLGVFEEMRSQYTVGFVPRGHADDHWHRIAVTVDVPAVEVRSRRGWLWEKP